MGRFDTTKATINANIKKNGNQEITGSILNSVMTEMVDATDAQLTELSAEVSELTSDLEIYKKTSSVLSESKIGAIFSETKYFAPSPNYVTLVFPVKADITYKVSLDIVKTNAAVAAVSFNPTNPTTEGYVEDVLKALDVVGAYEINYTPSKDGYIFIADTVNRVVFVTNQQVSSSNGEFIDFKTEISHLSAEIGKSETIVSLQGVLVKGLVYDNQLRPADESKYFGSMKYEVSGVA